MKFIIHFTRNGEDDAFIINGDAEDEIERKAVIELDRRGLTVETSNPWSEEVKP